jgi:hypothetical protein
MVGAETRAILRSAAPGRTSPRRLAHAMAMGRERGQGRTFQSLALNNSTVARKVNAAGLFGGGRRSAETHKCFHSIEGAPGKRATGFGARIAVMTGRAEQAIHQIKGSTDHGNDNEDGKEEQETSKRQEAREEDNADHVPGARQSASDQVSQVLPARPAAWPGDCSCSNPQKGRRPRNDGPFPYPVG